MELLLVSLLYAIWEIKLYSQPVLLGTAVPLAFLLLAPLVHRLRLRAGVRADAQAGDWNGSLHIQAKLVPLGETLRFPKKSRQFCLGCGVFLTAYFCGILAFVSALGQGWEAPAALSVLLHQLSVWGPFLLALLYWMVCRDDVSAFGDVFYAGSMVILCGIHRVLSWCSDIDAFPYALWQETLPWLLAIALLAVFSGRRRQGTVSQAG